MDGTKLIGGPYQPPAMRPGDWLDDEIAGRVEVGGYSTGRIAWPRRKKTGAHSLILCGALVTAVRTESALAIEHWFGVSSRTVSHWRIALGVDRQNNAGTQRLYSALAPVKLTHEVVEHGRARAAEPDAQARMRATRTGQPAPPSVRAGLLRAAKAPKPEGWGRCANEWMRRGKDKA